MPATILIMIFSNQIVQIIYGSTYNSAAAYLTVYCFLYFLVGIGFLNFVSLYNGLGETKITLRISLITFVVMLFLSVPLTSSYGVTGLIFAFLIASASGQIYALFFAKKRFTLEFHTKPLLKIYFISIISSAIPLLILNLANLPPLLAVAVGGTLYLLSYATLFPIIRTITPDELQKITYIIQGVPLLWVIAKPILRYQKKLLTLNLSIPRLKYILK